MKANGLPFERTVVRDLALAVKPRFTKPLPRAWQEQDLLILLRRVIRAHADLQFVMLRMNDDDQDLDAPRRAVVKMTRHTMMAEDVA